MYLGIIVPPCQKLSEQEGDNFQETVLFHIQTEESWIDQFENHQNKTLF